MKLNLSTYGKQKVKSYAGLLLFNYDNWFEDL